VTIVSLLTLLVVCGAALAQSHKGHNHRPGGHSLKDIPVQELNKPGSLSEISIGRPDAKITIIEYASMTCGHCGRFHRDLLPQLKAKYIDTGIARLVVREFPLDFTAIAVSMLARCAGPKHTYNVIATMFDRQQQWMRKGDIRNDIQKIMNEFGMSDKAHKRCMVNKELFHQIKAIRQRAIETFGVKSTPTFFINGKPLAGPQSVDEFDRIIQPMLKQ